MGVGVETVELWKCDSGRGQCDVGVRQRNDGRLGKISLVTLDNLGRNIEVRGQHLVVGVRVEKMRSSSMVEKQTTQDNKT